MDTIYLISMRNAHRIKVRVCEILSIPLSSLCVRQTAPKFSASISFHFSISICFIHFISRYKTLTRRKWTKNLIPWSARLLTLTTQHSIFNAHDNYYYCAAQTNTLCFYLYIILNVIENIFIIQFSLTLMWRSSNLRIFKRIFFFLNHSRGGGGGTKSRDNSSGINSLNCSTLYIYIYMEKMFGDSLQYFNIQ